MTHSNRHPETWRRVLSLLTAISLIGAQLALPPRAAAAPGSSTASAGSVPPPGVSAIQSFQPDLFTGRATTSVPIAVPPGRKGMQPGLALTYSSSARNGWLGVGWSLDVGYIERSTKSGPPSYGSSDIYTFMFQGVIRWAQVQREQSLAYTRTWLEAALRKKYGTGKGRLADEIQT